MNALIDLLRGDVTADRVVPPTGFTALLTLLASAAMAFLAVFVIAIALTAGRQADAWDRALTDTATVRISGASDMLEAQAEVVATILTQPPGIGATRRGSDAEQTALLAPWFGPEMPLDALALPVLIEVTLDGDGPDAVALAQRFAREAPGAVYDDHGRWRAPMVDAAASLKRLSWTALVLILIATGTTVALAASSALAANGQVIDVLRLVGAKDTYITRAFVRRYTVRAFVGGGVGALLGLIAVVLIPSVSSAGLEADIGFAGAGWLWPFFVPLLMAMLAFVATRLAAARRLKEVS